MSRILITGGSGSFGSAFVEYLILKTKYSAICVYSRDEWKQAEMKKRLGDSPRLRFFVGDVRDKDRLREALRGVDVVVHAAALKRIEVGHYNPTEMVKTNVMGAMNVVEASVQENVSKVVALSTDKAYQPCSPYGQSKALAESIFLAANNMHGKHGPKFSVVRYGNVWASRGSIVPLWKKLIEDGCECLPVTDPDCTRFFMTMDEAVGLVMETINRSNGGELVIPENLPAYSVGDLAEAFNMPIKTNGLPYYEKKHEGMRDDLQSDLARRMTIEELREAIDNV